FRPFPGNDRLRSDTTRPESMHRTRIRITRCELRRGATRPQLTALPALAVLVAGCGAAPSSPQWQIAPPLQPPTTGTDALLPGISVVDSAVVWVSGTNGRYARTTDGGATWTAGTVPDADSLQFRDVHAFDASRAYPLSIGNGPQS